MRSSLIPGSPSARGPLRLHGTEVGECQEGAQTKDVRRKRIGDVREGYVVTIENAPQRS